MTPSTQRKPTRRRGGLAAIRQRVTDAVGEAVIGQDDAVSTLLSAIAVGGHVLLEGVPGVAKTLLANATARALGLDFKRVQFTPDLLPSDVTGTSTLRGRELAFRPGPVFTNLLLADEINRTPPKTQAALLEAMQERQVTVEGEALALPDPFIVIATQNPIEYEGTYPLPEAQLDRFLVQLQIGYPSEADEVRLLGLEHRALMPAALDAIKPVVTAADLRAAQAEVSATTVGDEVLGYVAALVRVTRQLPSVALGASPRAGVHLVASARAAARLAGRDFVTPDDVIDMAPAVLRHRLILRPEAELDQYRPDDAVAAAIAAVPVPR